LDGRFRADPRALLVSAERGESSVLGAVERMTETTDTLEIKTFPDSVLRAKAKPITDIDDELQELADRMIHTMYMAPGIGLAANQVGQLRRLIVFERQPAEGRGCPCVLMNPEIVAREGEIVYEEACLSVVDFSAEVTRCARVQIRGVDRHGKPMDLEAEDLLAICLQHEIDHLNGVLFIDHISSLKRSLYKKRLKRQMSES
jgi:peptide deformylase